MIIMKKDFELENIALMLIIQVNKINIIFYYKIKTHKYIKANEVFKGISNINKYLPGWSELTIM